MLCLHVSGSTAIFAVGCCYAVGLLVIFMNEAVFITVLWVFTVLLIVITLLPFLSRNRTVIFAVCVCSGLYTPCGSIFLHCCVQENEERRTSPCTTTGLHTGKHTHTTASSFCTVCLGVVYFIIFIFETLFNCLFYLIFHLV